MTAQLGRRRVPREMERPDRSNATRRANLELAVQRFDTPPHGAHPDAATGIVGYLRARGDAVGAERVEQLAFRLVRQAACFRLLRDRVPIDAAAVIGDLQGQLSGRRARAQRKRPEARLAVSLALVG